MGRKHLDVLVVGAGVSGLTTAVCLAEAGLPVWVRTCHPPLQTTSAAAGALWGPHFVVHEHVRRWGQETLSVLEFLARSADAGVRLVSGLEVARIGAEPHVSLTDLGDFRLCRSEELSGGFASGWTYTAPVIDMPVYIRYLAERFADAGGKIKVDPVTSLDEVATQASITVNCTGFGARDLVPDRSLVPIRGDLVIVDNPGIDLFFAEETGASPDLTYIFPQGEHVVLGGTYVYGDANTRPDPRTADAILRRCAAVEPLLRGARIREHRVGIRPTRPRVRLEQVRLGRRHLIHNYGHGGAGVSLSWGCAREVLSLVERL